MRIADTGGVDDNDDDVDHSRPRRISVGFQRDPSKWHLSVSGSVLAELRYVET
jgi:hypothetical protein